MNTFVNLEQGTQGVGRDSLRHGDQADAHSSRQSRTTSVSEGLRGDGSAHRMVQNIGISRGNTSGGLSRQSGDIATRYGQLAHSQAATQEDSTQTGVSTHGNVSSAEDNVISTRISV